MKAQRRSNKRAVSPVIAYVLLIGMSIALAAIVTVWMKQSAKSQVETVITPIAGATECESVNVNVAFDYDACKLRVYNSGSLNISKLEIYILPQPNAEGYKNPIIEEFEFAPKKWNNDSEINKEINLQEFYNVFGTSATYNIEIFPVIRMDNQMFKCQKNKVFKSQKNFCNGCVGPC